MQHLPDRFDLEQQIMTCWSITEDLDTIYKVSDGMTKEQLQEAIKSLILLYNIKLDTMFSTFCNLVNRKEI